MQVDGLYVEERGNGAPILCIHGAGSSAVAWTSAIDDLARLGRVIAYDRRGCSRSERPEPYERTSVAEHAADAAAVLDALSAVPAVVIGRSYGGTVATELARRHPGHVRALVLLESDAPPELAPAAGRWIDALAERLRAVAERDGVDAVGEAVIDAVAGEGVWPQLPGPLRTTLTENGPALLAELSGTWWPETDAAGLAAIEQPVLLVAADDSLPELREPMEVLAGVFPNARLLRVAGGHLIEPAAPEILAFVDQAIARG